jgi:hypothetical protein
MSCLRVAAASAVHASPFRLEHAERNSKIRRGRGDERTFRMNETTSDANDGA